MAIVSENRVYRRIVPVTIILSLCFGLIYSGSGSSGAVTTGIWHNFPCGSISCYDGVTNNCGVGGSQDTCELMNSTFYRGTVFVPTTASLAVGFEVGCVTPATPTLAGSVLYLEYANYSLVSYLNTSKFQILSSAPGSIYIDNTNGWPCPGILMSDTLFTLPAVIPTGVNGFIFRVVGVCSPCPVGGNAGNPKLSFVRLIFSHSLQSIATTTIATIATTNFKWEGVLSLPRTVSTTISIRWIASNQTLTCGLTDSCSQEGSSSCVIAVKATTCALTTVTFTNAFSGTPAVIMQVLNPPVGGSFTEGGLSLFETTK